MGTHELELTHMSEEQGAILMTGLTSGERIMWLDPKGRAYLSARLDSKEKALRLSAATLPWPSGSAQPEADGYARKLLEAWIADMGISQDDSEKGIEQRSLSFRILLSPEDGLKALLKAAQPSQVWTFGLNLEA